MRRSSSQENVQRINFALENYLNGMPRAELKELICKSFSVSSRQAVRYMKEAKERNRPLPIPEQKIAFTVKLPTTVVQQIRQKAKEVSMPLSDIVRAAVEKYLRSNISRGTEKE